MASSSAADPCAPDTASLPLKMKKGTPSTPMARARWSSCSTARRDCGSARHRSACGLLQACRDGDGDQVFGPGQIDAVEEVSLQQSLFDPVSANRRPAPCRAGKRDQAVRGDGVGLARNPVERERDAVFGADRGHARIDVLARARRRISGARNPAGSCPRAAIAD